MRPSWLSRLHAIGVKEVIALDPAAAMAPDADLCLSIGAMDTAEPLPAMLGALRFALAPEALLIGAFAGGESLPVLRQAMRAADQVRGVAAAHVHPRIGAASFASLVSEAGFAMPVVDVDRVRLRYADFDALVRDLRAMAATNRLVERPRMPIMRAGRAAARDLIASLAVDGRTTETIEIIHFAAWTPGNRE